MMRTLALVVAVMIASGAPVARAATGQAGTSGAQFLKIGAGARAAAMAEAYAATADDPYALYYNPAGITRLSDPQVAAAHTAYFQGTNYEVVAFGYPLRGGRSPEGSKDVLGFSLYNLSVSDIERRTGDTSQPAGYFGAGDYSYNLSYAHRFDRSLSAGLSGKFIHQTIDTFSSSAYALDAGLQWMPRPQARRPLTVAAVLKNVGTRPKFAGQESDPLPTALVLGLGAPIYKNISAELDVAKYRDTDLNFMFGGEYRHAFNEGATGAFRLGYSTARRDSPGFNGVSLGAGIRFHRATFDFAWVPFGDLGNTFRYSLQIRFAGGTGSNEPKAAAPTPAAAAATPPQAEAVPAQAPAQAPAQ
ncbi:MAG: PorV/PorQ family protein [Elusimicrobia bacterium]|nr:PorV/PorQ family protein [Elusimicrobiota bacterium]